MTPDGPRLIDAIEGTAIPVRGDDIDTDRIIPARYLRSIRFEGLEAHVFEDERRATAGHPTVHPFSNPSYAGASILLVNGNFGCGSSREHAPQALMRWGVQAVVGESFSEIFFGNSLTLGVPCLALAHDDIARLMDTVEASPATPVSVSVANLTVRIGDNTTRASLPAAARDALLTGAWDATGLLLESAEDVEAVAKRLPYIEGFSS